MCRCWIIVRRTSKFASVTAARGHIPFTTQSSVIFTILWKFSKKFYVVYFFGHFVTLNYLWKLRLVSTIVLCNQWNSKSKIIPYCTKEAISAHHHARQGRRNKVWTSNELHFPTALANLLQSHVLTSFLNKLEILYN